MSDQDLPLSLVRPDGICGNGSFFVELATRWRPPSPPIASQERQIPSVTAEQAGNAQGHLEADGSAAADSPDSLLGRWNYTRNDTAGTIADPGVVNFFTALAAQGYLRRCTRNGSLHRSDPVFCEDGIRTHTRWQSPGASKVLDGTEKNLNPSASLQFTFRTSSASVTRRFGAGNVAGGRHAADVLRD